MSLYQQINNEALDEDLAVQRSVLERLKASVKDNKEKIRQTIKMSSVQRTELLKAIELVKKYIYKLYATIPISVRNFRSDLENVSQNIADIVITWNSLVGYLGSINFDKMQMDDRKFVESKLKDIPGLLTTVSNYYANTLPNFYLVPLSTLAEEITSTNIDRGESYGIIGYPKGTVIDSEEQKRFIERFRDVKYPRFRRQPPPPPEPEEEEEEEEEDEDGGYDPEEEERLRELGGQPEEDF